MPITTILCDLDGTLVDSRADIAPAFQHAWRTAIGGNPPTGSAISQHIGKPLIEMVSELGGTLHPAQRDAFLVSYRRAFVRQHAQLSRCYPEVLCTLRALSDLTLGVVTTKESQQAEIVLQRLALIRFFKHIQGASVDLRPKPAPDTIVAALVALRCEPLHALMVGDTAADMLAGKAAGTLTCGVTYGFGAREALLASSPNFVIERFGQVVDLMRELRG